MTHGFKSAVAVLSLGLWVCTGVYAQTPRVYFVQPQDGAVVTSPFVVKFGVEGKRIGPLGDMSPELGHHHLIIHGGPVTEGVPIPMDSTHLHYGKGQTEAELALPPGKYSLTMQFGNGAHQSYGAGMSQTISVQVNAPQ